MELFLLKSTANAEENLNGLDLFIVQFVDGTLKWIQALLSIGRGMFLLRNKLIFT